MKLKSEGLACGSPSLLSFISTIQFSHASEVSKLFDITLQTYGSIDILVNNAGIMMTTSVTDSMFPQYSLYAGTKGAVEQFTRQLAKELGPKGITINAVAPGPVNTKWFTQGKTEVQIETIKKMNSFNRLGKTKDITSTVLLLASKEAQCVTYGTVHIIYYVIF